MKPGAAPRPRRLAPPWVLAAGGAAMLLSIALIFPNASLFQQLGRGDGQDRADSLRVILLRDMLQKGAKGFALRRDYVRQLGLTGNYAEAFAALDSLAADPPGVARDSLRMLEAEISSWALSARSGLEQAAAARLRTALDALLREGPVPHLAWAADKARDAGAFDLAARICLRLAAADSLPGEWLRRAADMAEAGGDCPGASEARFAAGDRLADRKARKAAFLDGLRTLQACGRLDEALAAADSRIGPWRGDPEILLFLVQLARSANRPDAAQRYAHQLVKPPAADGR